jgi:GR25 family glycosyltransferase involved in LPS biosynthesis
MIYLGGNTNKENTLTPVNEYLNKSTYILTTHAYGINLQFAKKIIHSVEKLDDIIDCIYMKLHEKNNIYIPKEKLCFQSSGFSNIEEKDTNYNCLY